MLHQPRINAPFIVVLLTIFSLFSAQLLYAQTADIREKPLEMVIQSGHTNLVNAVAISPDGELIASGSSDKTVKLWTTDGKLIRTYHGHVYEVHDVAFSPDGKMIASVCLFRYIRLWDLEGNLLRTIDSDQGVYSCAAFSPDGTSIAYDGDNNTVRILNLTDNETTVLEGHTDKITDVAFSPAGNIIAVGAEDGTVRLWSADGTLLHVLEDHKDSITALAFHPDGLRLASSGEDDRIRIWNTEGRLLNSMEADFVDSLAYSPDGNYLLSAGLETHLWKADGDYIGRYRSLLVNSVAFSPDGRFFACGYDSHSISLWSLNGVKIRDIGKQGLTWKKDVSFAPDGKTIAAAGFRGAIEIWNLEGRLEQIMGEEHIGGVQSIAYSPDGNLIALSVVNDIELWNIKGELAATLEGHGGSVEDVIFSPDGKYLASASWDRTVRLWSSDGKLIRILDEHKDHVTCTAFSPDGKFLASACENDTINVWQTSDGAHVRSWLTGAIGYINNILFSPDGNTIISSTLSQISLWNPEGRLIRKFPDLMSPESSSGIVALAVSPDGKWIAGGGYDRNISIRDFNGKLISTFEGHSDRITGLAFSPDGKHLASSCRDSSAGIWNTVTGESVFLLAAENEWAAFTPDGYFDSSKRGGLLVKMVDGTKAFGVDQFATLFNRPDIILKRLDSPDDELVDYYYSLYRKRLRRMGLEESGLSLDMHVPTARISESSQNGKFIDLSFVLDDDKYELSKYNIYVNDIPLFGAYGKDIHGKHLDLSEHIELTTGRNKIEVSCFNSRAAESFRALLYADYTPKVKGDLYFLGFGVSQYRDRSLNLKYADKDVLDLAGIFSRMEDQFGSIHIRTYLNEEVTTNAIEKAKDFLRGAKTDDTLVLFIAGHGLHDRDEYATYYYLTHTADLDDLAGTCADFELIEDLLQGIAPRNKLFLMDTCESGEIDQDTRRTFFSQAGARGLAARAVRGFSIKETEKQERDIREYLFERDRYIHNDLIRRSGAIVFSSSRGGEFSYEREDIRNGVFTEAIIHCLEDEMADLNRDGTISTDELRQYVVSEVAGMTEDLQHPTVDRDNLYQKFSFRLPEQE